MEDSGSVRGIGWLCIISALGKRAGVVQWQYRSFPSFGRGFDSHRPLQILKKLRDSLIFHIFQNYNSIAKLGGKFGLHVFKWNLSGIECRHRSRCVSHLLAMHGRIDTSEFPPAVTSPTKGMQTRLL